MKQEECNVCFEIKEMYNNCCTFNTCNACLFLIDEENCLQCQKPIAITIPEPEPIITPKPEKKPTCFFGLFALLGIIFITPIFIIDIFLTLFYCEHDFYFTDQMQKFYRKLGFDI
jgi:hypothetical protein